MSLLSLLLFGSGCTGADKSELIEDSSSLYEINIDPSRLNAACIQENLEAEPQLTRGTGFEGSDWNDPHALNDEGGGFVLYASSDKRFNGDIALWRLSSTDGGSWALDPEDAVLEASAEEGAWDHRAVETPSVVQFQGKYHLFYTAYPESYEDVTSFAIGHATSDDGVAWARDTGPLLQPTDPTGEVNLDFDQFVVAEPGAVVFDDTLYLYFSAVGASVEVGTTLQVIGLTTTTDGETWTAPEEVLSPDQALFPRAEWVGYSTPAATVIAGELHLFFDVVHDAPWQQVRLHHASSADGRAGWAVDETSLLTTEDVSWASREIRAPSALLDGETLRLWFAGDDGATLGIGASSCDLGG